MSNTKQNQKPKAAKRRKAQQITWLPSIGKPDPDIVLEFIKADLLAKAARLATSEHDQHSC